MTHKILRLLVPAILSLLAISAMVSAFNADCSMIGRRLIDGCAEHDTFLAYTLQSIPSNSLQPGGVANHDYDLVATHPLTVVAAHGLPPSHENWCREKWEGCPEVSSRWNQVMTIGALASQTIYDDGTWVVKVTDVDDMSEMTVSITDTVYTGNAIVFNHRYSPTAGSWPEVFVLYANGFVRIKPLAQSLDQAENGLPCYGTSAVLGPFQFAPPLLDDAPHPELHPVVDKVDIDFTNPDDIPLLTLKGRFVNSTTTLINSTWLVSVTEVSTDKTQLDVRQHARVIEMAPLETVAGNGVLGIASLSSMWADTDTHDTDQMRITNDSGIVYQIFAGDIDGVDYGESSAISITTNYTLSLITTSATDHNVGAPDMHIHLKQASYFFSVYLPIIVRQ